MRFDSSYRKINRAEQHINDLCSVIARFTSLNPYRLICDYKLAEPIESEYEIPIQPGFANHYRIGITQNIPKDIGLIFGDAIHNLRSALDFIAFDLIVENGGSKQHTGFPFHETAEKFHNEIDNGKISCVPKNIKDIFHAVESFRGGRGDDIWQMNKLDNIDKHRMLLTAEFITGLEFGIPIAGLPNFPGRLENRNPNAYLLVTDRSILPNRETRLTFDIVIAESNHLFDRPLISTLQHLKSSTLGVIDKFEAAFSGM